MLTLVDSPNPLTSEGNEFSMTGNVFDLLQMRLL